MNRGAMLTYDDFQPKRYIAEDRRRAFVYLTPTPDYFSVLFSHDLETYHTLDLCGYSGDPGHHEVAFYDPRDGWTNRSYLMHNGIIIYRGDRFECQPFEIELASLKDVIPVKRAGSELIHPHLRMQHA